MSICKAALVCVYNSWSHVLDGGYFVAYLGWYKHLCFPFVCSSETVPVGSFYLLEPFHDPGSSSLDSERVV